MAGRRTFLIVGANLAGGRAAEKLRAEGFDGRIVLIGEEPHRPYERPPLSKEILRGEQPPEKAFLRPEEYYAENDIELLLGARATNIDTEAQVVALAEGISLGYDMLLLCTGGRVRTLDLPGADLRNVFTLRTIDDALAIHEHMKPGAKIVVVGAGFIGSEVAASASMTGAEVTLLEVAPVPLGRALGEEVGGLLGELHRAKGVDLRTGVRIEGFEGDGAVRAVALEDGTRFAADAVIVGVGIDPADGLARRSGIECDNGILVDEHCRTSVPNIYAAGDVANHPNPLLGHRIRVEHWQNAQNQAAAAAMAKLGSAEPFSEVPWFWSDQYDATIQMFGHPMSWDRIVFRGDRDGGDFAAFYLADDRIVASFGLNRNKDARAVRPLIAAGARVDPAKLADDGTDLRAYTKEAVG